MADPPVVGRPLAGRPVPGALAEVSARFGADLRRAGLPAGLGRCERFAAAVTVARPATLRALYLCAQATLVSRRDEAEILQAVFSQVFGPLDGLAGLRGRGGDPAAGLAAPPRPLAAGPAAGGGPGDPLG